MWDFAGESIPDTVVAGAKSLLDAVPPKLAAMPSAAEHVALLERARWVIEVGCFLEPDLDGRPYPWPRI